VSPVGAPHRAPVREVDGVEDPWEASRRRRRSVGFAWLLSDASASVRERTDGADVISVLLRDPNRVSLVVIDNDAGVDLGGRQELSVPRARTVLHMRWVSIRPRG